MNPSATFGCEMSRLRKGFRHNTIGRMLLVALVVFLAIFAVTAGIAKAGIWQSERPGLAAIGLLGLSLGFSLIYAALTRKSFIQRLIEMDRRLKLYDRISTAYEYHTSSWNSEISELLIADAAGTLSRLKHRQIFPRPPAVLSAVLLGLLVLNAVLLSIGHLAPGPQQATLHSEELAALRAGLQIYKARQLQPSPAANNTPQTDLSRKVQTLVQRLNESSMTADEKLQALNSILSDVRAAQQRLAQELSQKLGAAGLEEIPGLTIPEPNPHSLQRLSQLQEMLGQLFDGEIPEDIEDNVAALKEHLGLEERLSQLIDELNTGRAEPSGKAETLSAAADASDDAESPLHRRSESDKAQASGKQASAARGSRASADSDAEPDSNEQRDGGQGQVSISAGRQKGSDQKTSPYKLEKAEGPALRDQSRSTAGKNYRLLIRSSAAFNLTERDEEDIIRPYRQEVEGVLRKEDFPPNYREYIKNYFLAIGLRPEEKPHDSHP